ncbi:MocR family transcriptional regulator, partial [Microbacterium sp. SUBG005]
EQSFVRALPSLAYLMPDFHNPTGRTMGEREVAAFLSGARSAGTLLVLDETTGQLDIDRPGSAAPFPDDDRIIRVASLGKTVWGGLRVGWVRAAPDIVRRLASGRPVHDLGTPELEQAIATRLVPRLDEIARQRGDLLRGGRGRPAGRSATRLPRVGRFRRVHGRRLGVGRQSASPSSHPLVMSARSRGLAL